MSIYNELRQKILPQLVTLKYILKYEKKEHHIMLYRVCIPAFNLCYFASTCNESLGFTYFRPSCFKIKGLNVVDSMEYYDARNIERGGHVYKKDTFKKELRPLTLKEILSFIKTKRVNL